ncbi:hypothetical protein [Nocardiopsis potens]|uniref:hypothetical protein n=1 Tax=Nocardiopsis potens TaxID=1246458 RepID=UPI000349D99C|nr:hypothetical protein [Nocardiopsis potens]
MAEDQLKVTPEYLRTLREKNIDPMRELFSAEKAEFDQYYAGEEAKQPKFGNRALLPSAGVLSDEVKAVLTKVDEMFVKYEGDLLAISKGIANSELVFDDLEEGAEFTADQLNWIFSSSVTGGGGGGTDGDGNEVTSSTDK